MKKMNGITPIENIVITGQHLKLARLIYGYENQEQLGEVIGVSLGTIQRYEAMEEVDSKILGIYEHELHFDIKNIATIVTRWKFERLILTKNGK